MGTDTVGPYTPNHHEFEHGDEFHEFLLTKLINGEMACMRSARFASKLEKVKLNKLKEIATRFKDETMDI